MKERKLDAPVSVLQNEEKKTQPILPISTYLNVIFDILMTIIYLCFWRLLLFFLPNVSLQFSGLRKIILTIYLVIVIIFVVVLVLIAVFAPIEEAIKSLKSMSDN